MFQLVLSMLNSNYLVKCKSILTTILFMSWKGRQLPLYNAWSELSFLYIWELQISKSALFSVGKTHVACSISSLEASNTLYGAVTTSSVPAGNTQDTNLEEKIWLIDPVQQKTLSNISNQLSQRLNYLSTWGWASSKNDKTAVPKPEPVPPPTEFVIKNPWRESHLSATRRTVSSILSLYSIPWVWWPTALVSSK